MKNSKSKIQPHWYCKTWVESWGRTVKGESDAQKPTLEDLGMIPAELETVT